jgi:hypothetical protein
MTHRQQSVATTQTARTLNQGFGFQRSELQRLRVAERRHRTDRERMGSPTLQPLQSVVSKDQPTPTESPTRSLAHLLSGVRTRNAPKADELGGAGLVCVHCVVHQRARQRAYGAAAGEVCRAAASGRWCPHGPGTVAGPGRRRDGGHAERVSIRGAPQSTLRHLHIFAGSCHMATRCMDAGTTRLWPPLDHADHEAAFLNVGRVVSSRRCCKTLALDVACGAVHTEQSRALHADPSGGRAGVPRHGTDAQGHERLHLRDAARRAGMSSPPNEFAPPCSIT